MLPFVCSNIFAVHDTWRYQKLEQRWSIALACLQLFIQIASDACWTSKSQQVDTSGGQKLVTDFLREKSLFNILFSLIGLGGSYTEKVMKNEKPDEAEVVEKLFAETLKFVELLLKFRLNRLQQQTAFEDVLFFKLMGQKQTPLITILFELIDHPFTTDVSTVACRVIVLVARLTEQYHPRPPSLVGYLGNEAKALVGQFLLKLNKTSETETLKLAMLDLVSASVQIQRGLAENFLTYRKVATEDPENAKEPGDLVILILKVLNESIAELDKAHSRELIQCCLGVLHSIFQSGEYGSIMEYVRKSEQFTNTFTVICNTLLTNQGAATDTYIVKSATYLVSILYMDIYNVSYMRQLQMQQQINIGESMEPVSNDLLTLLKFCLARSNDFTSLIENSIELLMHKINNDAQGVKSLEQHSSRTLNSQGMYMNLSDYIIDTPSIENDAAYYDDARMLRWEGPKSSVLAAYAKKLNQTFGLTDALLSLLYAFHSLTAVTLVAVNNEREAKEDMKKHLASSPLLTSLLQGLRIEGELDTTMAGKQSKFAPVKVPLPVMLDKAVTRLHSEVSNFALTLINGMARYGILISHTEMNHLADMLAAQVKRKKPTICKELLAGLLLSLTKGADHSESQITVELAYKLLPILSSCVKEFGEKSEASKLAVSLQSVCLSRYYSDYDALFICNLLSNALEHYNGESNIEYVISLFNTVVALSMSKGGHVAIVDSNLIPKLALNSFLSRGAGIKQGHVYRT